MLSVRKFFGTWAYIKLRLRPPGNSRRYCWMISLMELCQYHTGLSSPFTTTRLHEDGWDISSCRRKSVSWSRVSCETHWRVNFNDGGGTPTLPNKMWGCTQEAVTVLFEHFNISVRTVCDYRQKEPSFSWVSSQPAQVLSCISASFKILGGLPWNAICLLDIVPEIFIGCLSFCIFFRIRLLVSFLLHSW